MPSEERPKRASISPEDIKRVQKVCLDIADKRRLLIALISDTGMRLSEALGLVWGDVQGEDQLWLSLEAPTKLYAACRVTRFIGYSTAVLVTVTALATKAPSAAI